MEIDEQIRSWKVRNEAGHMSTEWTQPYQVTCLLNGDNHIRLHTEDCVITDESQRKTLVKK